MNEPLNHPDEFRFHEYLDGELSSAAQTEVESHVAACAACSRTLAELQTLFEQVEGLPELELGIDLSPQIVARLERPALTLPAIRWVAVVQVLMAILLLAAAWPSFQLFTSSWPEPSQLSADWQVALAERIGVLGEQWSVIWEGVDLFVSSQAEALMAGPGLMLPQLGLTLLAASALLVWLVGNGLLLRGIRHKPPVR